MEPNYEDSPSYRRGVCFIASLFVIVGGLLMGAAWFIGLVLLTQPVNNGTLWAGATFLFAVAVLIALCALYQLSILCLKQSQRYVFSDGGIA